MTFACKIKPIAPVNHFIIKIKATVPVEALQIKAQRQRPDVGVEVEGCVGAYAQPLGHVPRVGQRGGKGQDADVPVLLGGHVPDAHFKYLFYSIFFFFQILAVLLGDITLHFRLI